MRRKQCDVDTAWRQCDILPASACTSAQCRCIGYRHRTDIHAQAQVRRWVCPALVHSLLVLWSAGVCKQASLPALGAQHPSTVWDNLVGPHTREARNCDMVTNFGKAKSCDLAQFIMILVCSGKSNACHQVVHTSGSLPREAW